MRVVAQSFLLCLALSLGRGDGRKKEAPIIGVLSVELTPAWREIFPNFRSYIAASYVKFLEGSGARVVPVWIGRDRQYYEGIVNKTNGMLFPGGATYFNETDGYVNAGLTIYQLAVEQNLRGRRYPLLGICLGFQLLVFCSKGGTVDYRARCSAFNLALPLNFKPDFKNSTMYRSASQDVIDILKTENLMSHFHHYCYTEEILDELRLGPEWHVLTTNEDENGLEFISSMESRRFPFFGLQFHPEKTLYEWYEYSGIVHTYESLRCARHFGDMFVNEAKRSANRFPEDEESRSLIFNYDPINTGRMNLPFDQCYFFNGSEKLSIE